MVCNGMQGMNDLRELMTSPMGWAMCVAATLLIVAAIVALAPPSIFLIRRSRPI